MKWMTELTFFQWLNSPTTIQSPLQREYHPFMPTTDKTPFACNPMATARRNPASKAYAYWMHTVHEGARQSLEKAQERMCKYADQH
jgi:hypothetical protein